MALLEEVMWDLSINHQCPNHISSGIHMMRREESARLSNLSDFYPLCRLKVDSLYRATSQVKSTVLSGELLQLRL